MDLNQLVGELGYLPHFGWKNCYSSRAWLRHESEGGERCLLHLQAEVGGGGGAGCVEVRDTFTDV